MRLTSTQMLIMILAVAAGAAITRFAPFICFPSGKNRPAAVSDLGGLLPPAMMGLLVVYCLRNVQPTAAPYGMPELFSIALIVVLHLWKRNMLLSIGAGTAVYMLLVQVVFPAG